MTFEPPAPAPEPSESEPTQPTQPAESEAEVVAYTPEPEHRPDWARSAWLDPAPGEPSTPTEPVTPAPVSAARGGSGDPVDGGGRVGTAREPRRVGLGSIVAASVLSAVLASGGTVVLLQSSGALVRPAAPGASSVGNLPSGGTIVIDDSSAVVNAAAKVSPAVVRITAEGVSANGLGGALPETGIGSGIIYDPDGWILTNRHVVTTSDGSVASKLTVELKDGREFTGTVYGIDTLTDLSIVKVDATGLPAAPIGRSADIKVGQLAIAIGSPLGTYTSTVTTGIISATGRTVNVDSDTRLSNLIQTDAAINPGNSGGPLLDATGAVIGINTAVERDSTGIGFAIPVDIARPIMSQALAGEPLTRPYIGIRFTPIDAKVQKDEGLPVAAGALIGSVPQPDGSTLAGVTPGSPAAAAGLKDGDIITQIESIVIDTEHPLDADLTSFRPGQTVTLTVLRGSDTLQIKVTLGTRPEKP
ncbi:MAG TPA: trypsin-like peptidase domain-containing protein [Candidatus Limnocylindrales bacterium]|nr:trypsin-like peptidase domain-containing protein [Candidatus Limnocylindrales bacterium]